MKRTFHVPNAYGSRKRRLGHDAIAAYTASLDLNLMCTSHHWGGIDIHDLAKSSTDLVISEQWLYSLQFQAAGGESLKCP